TLRPGQKLVIPAASSVPLNRVPTRAEASRKATQQAMHTMRPANEAAHPAPGTTGHVATPVGTPAHATPAAPPGGSYTVQAGESFYGSARKHKVKAEDLAQLNGVTDVAKIRQGQVLKIPELGAMPAATVAAAETAAVVPGGRPAGAPGTKVAALGNAA